MLTKGQIVKIKTVNHGWGGSANRSSRLPKITTWTGRVIGPSPLGHDLWLIKGKAATYTVPRHEINQPKE